MDPVSILDGVISNLLFAQALGIDKRLSSIRSVARAISATAAEVPFCDAERTLTAWVDCVDLSDNAPGDRAATQRLIAKYCEVATIAGVSTDELTAASIVERFGVHLDRLRRLDIAAHDARESARYAGLSDQITQSAAENRNSHDAILREIQKLTASSGGTVTKLSPSAKNLASVEALVDAGLFATARDRIRGVPDEVELDHADAVSYHTFSGICAYHLGDVHGAVQSFQRASDLKPESSKTASNLAAAYLADGDYDKAIGEARRARNLSPNLAPINLIAALHAASRDSEALALIDEGASEWQEDEQFHTIAARLYVDLHRAEDALRASRCAVALKRSVDAQEVLAISLLSYHQGSRILTSRSDLTEAVNLLSHCIDELKGWQSSDEFDRLLVNRAVAYALLRDYHRALRDCERVSVGKHFQRALSLKFRALAGLENWHLAISAFAAIEDPTLKRELTIVFADVLLSAGRPQEALQTVQQFVSEENDISELLSAVHVGTVAALALADRPAAEALISSALPSPEHWAALAARAYLDFEMGENERGLCGLKRALLVAPELDSYVIRINLARALMRVGQPRAAVAIYDAFVTPDSDLEIVESCGAALCRAGFYEKFVSLYTHSQSAGTESPPMTELRVRVFERLGDLPHAANALEQQGDRGVESSLSYLRAARLRLRLGQTDIATGLARKVSVDDLLHKPRELMWLAEVYDAVDINPLNIAYRALMLSNDPHEPAAYVRLCAKWLTATTSPSIATEGLTFELESTGKTSVTVSDVPLDIGLSSHYPSGSPIAKALVNRQVGDQILINGSALRLISVGNKFHSAMAMAIDSSPAKHAKASLIGPIIGKPPRSDENSEARTSAQLLRYERRELSIGRFADLSDTLLVIAYSAQLERPTATVEAFVGDNVSCAAEVSVVHQATEITLELTALLTFARLGLLELLGERFETVYISQAVVDELALTLRGMLFAERTDGVVRRAMVTESGVVPVDRNLYDRERSVLQAAWAFATKQATICGWTSAIEMSPRNIAAQARKYGRVPLTSLVIASATQTVLVIDDVVSRKHAASDGVAAASSHSVLKAMLAEDRLAVEQYERSLLILRGFNYQFLSLCVDDLSFQLHASAEGDISDFVVLCGQMASPLCEVDSLVLVAAGVVLRAWMSQLDISKKTAATAVVLYATALNRPIGTAIAVRDRVLTDIAKYWQRDRQVEQIIGGFIQSFDLWSARYLATLRRIVAEHRSRLRGRPDGRQD